MKRNIFITGTDTEVGKTYVSSLILCLLNDQDLRTIGLKPIAAGACEMDGELKNEDAVALQAAASVKLPYSEVNPFCCKEAIAPHIAASHEGRSLSVEQISHQISTVLRKTEYDICLIEGAGGWYVPLNDEESLSDLVVHNDWDVVLVVGIKLGCINHALLSAEALKNSGVNCVGWIANCVEPESNVQHENIETLIPRIDIPYLGKVGFCDEGSSINLLPLSELSLDKDTREC
jgi:dethiobiotin synthetase